MKGRDNKGFEGVAFDEAMQCIYVVNEKIPRQLLTIEGLSARAMTLQIALNPDLIPRRFFLKDLSACILIQQREIGYWLVTSPK